MDVYEENESLKSVNEALKETVTRLTAAVEELRGEKTSVYKMLADREEEYDFDRLYSDIISLQEKAEDTEKLKEENKNLYDQLNHAVKMWNKYEAETLDLKSKNTELSGKYDAINSEYTDTLIRLEKEQEEYEYLNYITSNLKSDLADANSKIISLGRGEPVDFSDSDKDILSNPLRMYNEIDKLRREAQSLSVENSKLNEEIEDLKREKEELRKSFDKAIDNVCAIDTAGGDDDSERDDDFLPDDDSENDPYGHSSDEKYSELLNKCIELGFDALMLKMNEDVKQFRDFCLGL